MNHAALSVTGSTVRNLIHFNADLTLGTDKDRAEPVQANKADVLTTGCYIWLKTS